MIYDRLHVLTSTPGTGAYTVSGTATNRLSLDDALDAAGVTRAGAKLLLWVLPDDSAGSDDFEYGEYTYDGTSQLARTRIIRSSNSDAAVSWGATQRNIVSAPNAAMLRRLLDIVFCRTVGGTANAITLTPDAPVGERLANRLYLFVPAATNTGATQANPSGLGLEDVEFGGLALSGGEIVNGRLTGLLDMGSGNGFELIQLAAVTELPGAVVFSGQQTPAQITATQNDYAPTGLSTAAALRLSSDAARSITGLAGGRAGRRMALHNVGSYAITLAEQDAGSAAANRFAFRQVLLPGASIEVEYDATSQRWRAIGKAVGGSLLAVKVFGYPTNFSDSFTTAFASNNRLTLGAGAPAQAIDIDGTAWRLTTTGTLPAPLQTGTDYYIKSVPTSSTVTLCATPGGAEIVLTSNGSGTHTIAPLGTYTKNPEAGAIEVEVVGGGGSGGGSVGGGFGGQGGAGGGAARKRIANDNVGATETVTVGPGGAAPSAGANSGNAGSTSSFGAHCSATGGDGGAAGATQNPNAGGIGAGGDDNMRGQGGGVGTRDGSNASAAGPGGSSPMGGGGGAAGNGNGGRGGAYGGGGGGAGAVGSSAGGRGYGGMVKIREYA